MDCAICRTEIKTPFYVEVNVRLVKYDDKYHGTITFTPNEKKNINDTIIIHLSCWESILDVKKGKVLEVK